MRGTRLSFRSFALSEKFRGSLCVAGLARKDVSAEALKYSMSCIGAGGNASLNFHGKFDFEMPKVGCTACKTDTPHQVLTSGKLK